MSVLKIWLYLVGFCLLFSSCRSYKQGIMFRTAADDKLRQEIQQAESNYIIQKNDYLQLEVYTNGGEKLVDPNQESFNNTTGLNTSKDLVNTYLVDINGLVKFPLLDTFKLEGLTIRQAEDILKKEYTRYYQQPFIVLKYNNKRVVVLGALGGHVIPLVNENMRLTEIMALTRVSVNDFRANNIRVLRGDQLLIADFSSFEGYQKSNVIMQPNDIIYIEPIRRPFIEALRDYSAIATILTSITTLTVLIIRVN